MLFSRLNRSLYQSSAYQRTFVCFIMGSLDLRTRRFQLINGGVPYPLYYRAARNSIVELELDAYPLGASLDSRYPTADLQLETGDYLVFCSDGIMESASTTGEIFGYERTANVVHRCCARALGADALIGELFAAVQRFAAGEPQEDDMTCMVLRVEA